MTVFLQVLKICGIVLACLIGLILLFIFLLLTVPFRYTAVIDMNGKKLKADANVRWDLKAVRFWYSQYEDGTHDGELLLFGIRLMRFDTDSGWLARQIEALKQWALKVYRGIAEAPEGPLECLLRIRRELTSPQWETCYKDLFQHLKTVILEVFPKEGNGNILFGTEDPYLTGKLLELLAVFYPLYGRVFAVCPEFNSKVFIADLDLKGRLKAGKILYHAALLLYGRKSKDLYREFMRLTHNEERE